MPRTTGHGATSARTSTRPTLRTQGQRTVPGGVDAGDPTLLVPLAELHTYHRNPRRGDVAAIAASLDTNGAYKPLTVNVGTLTGRPHEVLAGNHTMQAAARLGWDRIAVVWVDVDDDAAARIVLADNRTSDLATYSTPDLSGMLADLAGDFTGTGWEPDAAAAIMDTRDYETGPATGHTPPDDDAIPPLPVVVRTRPGDVWILGRHHLVCGDARDPAVVDALLDGHRVNLAFTSPPYASRRKYDETSPFRPIPPEAYVEWFAPVAAGVQRHLALDGSWFINVKAGAAGLDTDTYVLDLVLAHVRQWGWHWATEFCWRRRGMPKQVTRRFKNQFEPIYQFVMAEWKMRPDVVMTPTAEAIRPLGAGAGDTSWADELDRRGFDAARVVEGMAYPGNVLPPMQTEATGHTAAFPVALPAWFMRAYTDPGDLVYDPFLGSGSTLIAAQREQRTAYGCEISPAYCDQIARRWQELTGELPVRASTGEVVDFTAEPVPVVS